MGQQLSERATAALLRPADHAREQAAVPTSVGWSATASRISASWPIATTIVMLWLFGVAWRLVALVRGYRTLDLWRRYSIKLPLELPAAQEAAHRRLRSSRSTDVATPMVVGLRHPLHPAAGGFARAAGFEAGSR